MRVTHPRRLACFWLAGALSFVAASLHADDAAPHAVVDAPVHDFGTIEQGEAVEHVFRLRNAGTSVLRVDHVKGTCACTVGVATGEAIAPGDETWVTVRLDTTRLSGRTTKTATVYTSDPAMPTIPLTLTGQVLTDLVARPAPLYVGHLPHGTVLRREIRVAAGRPDGVASLLGVEVSSPRLHAWIDVGEGNEQRVVVEIDGTESSGRFSDDLVLRTTSARQPTLTVKVLGTIDAVPENDPRG